MMRDGLSRLLRVHGRLVVGLAAGVVLLWACAPAAPPADHAQEEPAAASAEVEAASEPSEAAVAEPAESAAEVGSETAEPEPVTEPGPAADPEPAAEPAATERTGEIPADHTKDRDGAMHKKGSSKAWVKCTPCHGKDLRGKENRPSCFECHENEWDDEDDD